ncbi:hypothetical protein BH18ACI4_BH18ACI4_00920 [soil metagenome]
MKRTEGHGNGSSETTGIRFTTEVIEENPYLQPRPDEQQKERSGAENDVCERSIEDEEGSPVELEDERRKVKQRRRRLAMTAVATLLLISLIGAVALYYRSVTRVEYGRTTKQREVLPPPPNVNTTTGRDTRTEQAIEEAQRLTVGKAQTTGTPNDKPTDSSDLTPFNVPRGFSSTFNTTADETDTRTNTESTLATERGSAATPSTGASGSDPRSIRSQRSSEGSLYINDPAAERTSNAPLDGRGRADSKAPFTHETKPNAIMLPAFASMLPVRTIGALYTLRTGALVRFELTRETKGNGWSMKRSTVLVGTSKGRDYDRAYVSIIGFIDPQSGKLVKLGGDVRGGDGGAGLKGKRRQLDGGWARALGLLGNAALDVTGALLSGRGRDTVIISDGLRTRAINPVTDEISGLLGSEMDRRESRSFVEVVAGTPGYVMVTDLPAVIKGTEATPEQDSESLASLTDVDATRPATGLSEHELAELLATGSPEQITAAMPRMSSEMRKIAAAVLRHR